MGWLVFVSVGGGYGGGVEVGWRGDQGQLQGAVWAAELEALATIA